MTYEISCTKFSNLTIFTKISQTMRVMILNTFTWAFLMKTQFVTHGTKMKNFCLNSRPMKNNHLCQPIILLLLIYCLILSLVVLSRAPLCFTFPTIWVFIGYLSYQFFCTIQVLVREIITEINWFNLMVEKFNKVTLSILINLCFGL